MMKLLASKQTMDNKTETVGDASQPIKPKHDIMGKALVRMTEGTLIRLGIRHPEHVEAIWREILKLRLKADIQEMKEIEMSSIIS
ncbi:protein aveugle isoform X2 [Panulirus ornatus]|uniref:protein aveugle isoform X2 n=1 Tax=Panulirus ornatus TaxID=150431 RepID=UPI003A86145C